MFTSPRRSDIRDLSNKSFKIFSIHILLDVLTTIKVISSEIDEEINCVSVFQNHVTLRMVWIWLRNRPAKLLVKSPNKNMELHISRSEIGTLSQTMILLKYPFIQH